MKTRRDETGAMRPAGRPSGGARHELNSETAGVNPSSSHDSAKATSTGPAFIPLGRGAAPIWDGIRQRIVENSIPEPNSGCWLWLRSMARGGYGSTTVCGKTWRAHRASYEAFIGPSGAFNVCHKCDVPSCVNPDHLWLGTTRDNVADKIRKGRQPVGRAFPGTKLTVAQVQEIRDLSGSSREIGKRFGVHSATILRVRNGQSWGHV